MTKIIVWQNLKFLVRKLCLYLLNMETFLEYIEKDNYSVVINTLCYKRAKEADKRNKHDKLRKLSSDYKVPDCKGEGIYDIMPPRKSWVKLNYSKRTIEVNGNYRQRKTSFDYNVETIRTTISRDTEKYPGKPYLVKLNKWIKDLIDKIKDPNLSFNSISTIPIVKKHNCKGYTECRPISIFSDLSESIILTLANKYLSKKFDDEFYEESLAFRPKRQYHGECLITSHHDAIKTINNYRQKNNNKEIFVAECDIKKFYDTVSHKIVKRLFNEIINKKDSKVKDKYIRNIFNSYLKCYTFPKNVYKFNDERNGSYWLEHNIKNGKFNWVFEDFINNHLYKNKHTLRNAKVGVPQGGALSGLIANLVLNYVDQKIKANLTDEDLYVRFCDDMILLSTNKEKCKSIFNQYMGLLKEIRLIPHEPDNDNVFNRKNHWNTKTKDVYKWALKENLSPEWIGFVGYEIKRDGCVRIRKSSLMKEIKKQKHVVNELYEIIKNKKRVYNKSLIASYSTHLINMSVGKVHLWNAQFIKNDFCWLNGFRELNMNKYASAQIRKLDLCRNKTLRIANKKYSSLEENSEKNEQYNNNDIKDKSLNIPEFYGYPFSYYYHYKKNSDK